MDESPGSMHHLEIEALGNRVGGIARPENGSAVFVKGALPGETISCRITSSKKSFREAELLEVLKPSPWRRDPVCRFFGTCGGCSLQNLDYRQQLLWKRVWVGKAIERAGIPAPSPEETAACPVETGYRNRISFDIVDGRTGLHRFRGDPMPVDNCPLLIRAGGKLLRDLQLLDLHGVRRATVRGSASSGQTMLELRGGSPLGAVPEPWALLSASGWWVHPPDSPPFSDEQYGFRYPIPPGGFFQVNPWMAEKLTELVVERCSGGMVLDLYGGVGALGLPIASSGAKVVSVELDGASSDAGREAARINGVDSIEFVHMRDRNYLSASLEQGIGFDTVVTDPPRAGMGIRISRMVTRLKARSIIYVSCNPFSLARDMACLIKGGYIAREILPLDMFPQTDHVEVLVLLEREG